MRNNSFMKVLKGNSGTIAVLVIIPVILNFAPPVSPITNSLLPILRQVSNNMHLALGMTLVIILEGIDLSVGTCVAICGALTAGLMVNQGIPMVPAVAVGLLLGALARLLNRLITTTFKVPAFIVAILMMNMVKGVAYIYSGGCSIRVSSDMFTGIETGKLFGVLPFPAICMIVLTITFIVVLNKIKLGTYIFAIGGNRKSVGLSGVPIKEMETTVSTISKFLAAFAGIVLSARMYSEQPGVGGGYGLDAIAACVLGDISMTGDMEIMSRTIFGALVVGITSNGLSLVGLSSFW